MAHVACQFSGHSSEVILKYFFLTMVIFLSKAKGDGSSISSGLCLSIAREDVISASKFCKITARWGETQCASSFRAVERGLEPLMEAMVEYDQKSLLG